MGAAPGSAAALVFPAHAGVSLTAFEALCDALSFPRTRGGEPGKVAGDADEVSFSPHTRG